MPGTCYVLPYYIGEAAMEGVHNLMDWSSPTAGIVKCALMKEGFVYDPALYYNYSYYSDLAIKNNEISTAGGYSTGGILVQNTSWGGYYGQVTFTCDPPVFTASGADMDGADAVVFYDDFYAEEVYPGKTVICIIQFSETYVVKDGQSFLIDLGLDPGGNWPALFSFDTTY